ncbi:hypothetical protein CEXT_52861 [Caerostris extrusa]|uniref:Uncharacterized protein n=1 Tax=Caerostris extrusa TaxID=172846 RepID=A0AAV4UJV0_CAEEX|nr:hypothetical protein CEXT_52861 [Caerostris extrusa]
MIQNLQAPDSECFQINNSDVSLYSIRLKPIKQFRESKDSELISDVEAPFTGRKNDKRAQSAFQTPGPD